MKSGSLRHPWLSLTDTFQNGDSLTEMGNGVFGAAGLQSRLLTFFNIQKQKANVVIPYLSTRTKSA